jgi:hypothetical protein
MLEKLRIRTKLVTVFGVIFLGILVLAISGNLTLKKDIEIAVSPDNHQMF